MVLKTHSQYRKKLFLPIFYRIGIGIPLPKHNYICARISKWIRP